MGLAIDTVLYDVHNATTAALGLTTATVTNSGDPAQVRSFDGPARARMYGAVLHGSGTRQARITSPRLHDNVTGLTWQSPEQPAEFLFPSQGEQEVYSVDQFNVSLDAAASSDTILAALLYYDDLGGIAQDLRTWEQVKANLINYKVMEVAVTTSATPGTWVDTVITTTENQLKADYKYALLGFQQSAAIGVVGLKGPATGNLRICCPGASATFPLTEYFIRLSEAHKRPFIPVFKANDRSATFISAASQAASAADNVYAILAQLPA
jgi:hypothetical protein